MGSVLQLYVYLFKLATSSLLKTGRMKFLTVIMLSTFISENSDYSKCLIITIQPYLTPIQAGWSTLYVVNQ